MISFRKILRSITALVLCVVYASFAIASNNGKQEAKLQNEESLFKALFHVKAYTCNDYPLCEIGHSEAIEGESEPKREIRLGTTKHKKVN